MKTKMTVVLAFCLVLSLVFSSAALSRTLNVPSTTYPTIRSAIVAAVDGDVVLVAAGTYTGPDNKNLDFLGKAITVQSESGPEVTIIDCENDGRGFYFGSEGPDSVL
jgi:hypothetical protein